MRGQWTNHYATHATHDDDDDDDGDDDDDDNDDNDNDLSIPFFGYSIPSYLTVSSLLSSQAVQKNYNQDNKAKVEVN